MWQARTYVQDNLTIKWFVISIHFSKEHEDMLAHCKELIEYQNGQIAIHPRFNKLITALRTAAEKGGYVRERCYFT